MEYRDYKDLDPRPFEGGIATEPEEMEEIEEYCSTCNDIVLIPDGRITRCPDCGNYQRPCAGCSDNEHPCNWSRNTGCWRFPFASPFNIGTMIQLDDGQKGFIEEYDCRDDGTDLKDFCAYQVDFGDELGWEIVYSHDIAAWSDDDGKTWVFLKTERQLAIADIEFIYSIVDRDRDDYREDNLDTPVGARQMEAKYRRMLLWLEEKLEALK